MKTNFGRVYNIKEHSDSLFKQIETSLNYHFDNFINNVIKESEKLTSGTILKLSDQDWESTNLFELKRMFISASSDALKGILRNYGDEISSESRELDEDFKYDIDLAIADEQIYNSTLLLVTDEYWTAKYFKVLEIEEGERACQELILKIDVLLKV